MDRIFIFDMDGVIVDTRNEFYDLYLRFLKSFGKKASLEECKRLDGFKLDEIIAYAKKKHHLPYSEEELTLKYNKEIELVYSQAPIIKKIDKVLKTLRKYNCQIALASSAKRRYIDRVLERFRLKKYFDFVVSGDDVSQAKPSPEIYNRVRSHFGNKEYYVIEDSTNGIAAAAGAKMKVIFFNAHDQKENKLAEYAIREMDEMKEILTEIETECRTVALADKIEVRLCDEKIPISEQDQEIVESYWKLQKAQNRLLFNGTILNYLGHQFEGETLHIDCCFTEYNRYLAQLGGRVSLNIKPLAVSGIILDEEINTLLAKRGSTVTEYKGYYEFVPSGGLSKEDIKDQKVQFKERLIKELEEETTLSSQDILEVAPFGLILDQKDKVFDIGIKIMINGSLSQRQPPTSLIRSNEYSHPHIVPVSEIRPFFQKQKIVPTSLNLLAAIEENIKNSAKNSH